MFKNSRTVSALEVYNVTTAEIKQIYILAFLSRLSFLFLSLLSNFIISDHNSDSFTSPTLTQYNFNFLDKIVWFLFSGLLRWDAQHFLHIASSGYTYENNLPFFPLFPVIVKYTAFLFKHALSLHPTTSTLLSAVLINCLFFVKSSSTLYKLSLVVFKNENIAYYSVLFFCISPATIFFLAPYSECLFSFCVFSGMLHYTRNKYWCSLFWFSTSVLVRANGIINIGFILHIFFYFMSLSKFKCIKSLFRYSGYSLLSLICIFLPFVVYQLYAYLLFCISRPVHSSLIQDYALNKSLLLPGFGTVWCDNSLPISYSYIQKHYWDVGFLRYYSIKQLPNFCLAFPMVLIICKYCVIYLIENWRLLFHPEEIYLNQETFLRKGPKSLFVFIVHVTCLTVFAIFNINVQVTTRLIASSSPVIYWLAAQEFVLDNKKLTKKYSFFQWVFDFRKNFKNWSNIMKWYFLSYSVLGTVLFSNNYPWT